MAFAQSNWQEIVDSEHQMVLQARDRFGEFYVHAMDSTQCLDRSIKSISRDRAIFAAFFTQVKKHHALALLSSVRLHHVQAMMDMRQVIEAGAAAAYAIANPSSKGFVDISEDGIADSSQHLAGVRYKWLDENFANGSDALKNLKKILNSSTSHASLVYAYKNITPDASQGRLEMSFFDKEDDYHVKSDLWFVANIVIGVTDLFYGVAKTHGGVVFADTFLSDLQALQLTNQRLKSEMMKSPRFVKSAVPRE